MAALLLRAARRTVLFAAALVLVALVWEGYRAIGPGTRGAFGGVLPSAGARDMPSVGAIVRRLGQPETGQSDDPIWWTVLGYAWDSGKLAVVGFVVAVVVGVALAVLMARFRIAERALLPWVVMSQTVPLMAISPQVAGWRSKLKLGDWQWPPWASIVLLAVFLAFFPIAVGTLRGLTSAAPAALELMDSYAASWTRTLFKLRFPAAVPHVIPALKLAAGLSVIGVIVAELSIGGTIGVGRLVVSYLQFGSTDPLKLYAAVFAAAVLGMAMYGLVVVLDVVLMRNRPEASRS